MQEIIIDLDQKHVEYIKKDAFMTRNFDGVPFFDFRALQKNPSVPFHFGSGFISCKQDKLVSDSRMCSSLQDVWKVAMNVSRTQLWSNLACNDASFGRTTFTQNPNSHQSLCFPHSTILVQPFPNSATPRRQHRDAIFLTHGAF